MALKRKQIAVIAGVIVVALVAWRVFAPGSKGPEMARGPGAGIPVVAEQVMPRDVPLYLVGIGTVQAYNTVTVRARVDGELMRVVFREGQDVKKGDLLAEIDPRPYQAALDNALAVLARDQATLANSKRDLARYTDTAAKGYTSRQQLDTQTANVTALSAAVQAGQATVENARVQLGYTSIVSPLDGRTGIRLVDQGNIVKASDPTGLVVITQVQPVAAIFTLPQDKLPTVTAALDKGKLAVTAYSRDDTVELGKGTLELVDNQIDPSTGTVKLKARFDNPDRRMWPGEFINARLQVGDMIGGLTVQAQVVQRGANGPYAYVIKADSTVEARTLQVGQEDRGQILVTKGLMAGERVVVDGQLRLQPGAKVQVVDPTANQQRDAKAADPAGTTVR